MNFELMRKTLEHIKSLPPARWCKDYEDSESGDHWAQDTFGNRPECGCGTYACFAGWGIILSKQFKVSWEGGEMIVVPKGKKRNETYWWDIAALARELFGLNTEEGRLLFHENNTIEQIEALINKWEAKEKKEVEV